MQGALRGLGQEAGIAGVALTAGLTAPLAAIAQVGVSFADLAQKSQIGFATMLGSADAAKKMLQDLASFAARTPFELKDLIPQAQRMMAMGIEARNVIPALNSIGDAVAALGGGSALIDRVTLAIGQMSAKGKVSAQEMRQLAEAGIPAWDILAQKMGISVPDAMKKAEDGAISSTVAIQALVEGMNARFGGMMEQTSKLASGALSNLKDAADQALGSLMMPVLDQIAVALNAAIPYIQAFGQALAGLDESTRVFIVGIGAAIAAVGPLLVAFGAIAFAVSFLITPVGLVVAAMAGLALAAGIAAAAFVSNWNGVADRFGPVLQQIGDAIGRIAEQALDWGANVIVAFANGMASAVDAIVQVLNFITDIISFWMAPGSPPKFLPDLDTWGAGAMTAYMSGWKNGDFSVFDELAGTVEQELRNAFRTGGGFDLFEAIMGTRSTIADAMTQMRDIGDIGADTMNRIRDAAGPVADIVEKQVRLYGDLERATRDVESAERDLQALQREKDKATQPLERELAAIRNQKDAIADAQELARLAEKQKSGKLGPDEAAKVDLDIRERQIRQQIRAIEDQKNAEIDAAKDRLDSAKDLQTDLKDQVSAQKAQQEELQKNIALWDEFHAAAGGGGAAGGGAAGLANKLKLDLPDLTSKTDELKGKWAEMTGPDGPFGKLMAVWDRLEKGLPDPFEKMATSVETLVKHIQEAFALQDSRPAPSAGKTGATEGEKDFNVGQTATPGGAIGGLLGALGSLAGEIGRFLERTLFKQLGDMIDLVIKNSSDAKDGFGSIGEYFKADGQFWTDVHDWTRKILNLRDSFKEVNDLLDLQKDPQRELNDKTARAAEALSNMAARANAWSPPLSQMTPPPAGPAGVFYPPSTDIATVPEGRAAGGPIWAGETYRVHKDEVIYAARNGMVQPANQTGGAGHTFNISVNAGGDSRDIAESIVDAITAGLRNPTVTAPG